MAARKKRTCVFGATKESAQSSRSVAIRQMGAYSSINTITHRPTHRPPFCSFVYRTFPSQVGLPNTQYRRPLSALGRLSATEPTVSGDAFQGLYGCFLLAFAKRVEGQVSGRMEAPWAVWGRFGVLEDGSLVASMPKVLSRHFGELFCAEANRRVLCPVLVSGC